MGITITDLAMLVHEQGRSVYRAFNLHPYPAWNELEPHDQDVATAIVTVAMKDRKLNGGSYHQIWRTAMTEEGWVIGPMPDYPTKQHPGLVDFTKLPAHDRQRCQIQADLIATIQAAKMLTETKSEPQKKPEPVKV